MIALAASWWEEAGIMLDGVTIWSTRSTATVSVNLSGFECGQSIDDMRVIAVATNDE
jgi:hypothetical protein